MYANGKPVPNEQITASTPTKRLSLSAAVQRVLRKNSPYQCNDHSLIGGARNSSGVNDNQHAYASGVTRADKASQPRSLPRRRAIIGRFSSRANARPTRSPPAAAPRQTAGQSPP